MSSSRKQSAPAREFHKGAAIVQFSQPLPAFYSAGVGLMLDQHWSVDLLDVDASVLDGSTLQTFVDFVSWCLIPRPHHRQRSRVYGFDPVGFSFAFVRSFDLPAFPTLKCNRFCWPRKSSGPPPFATSLKVQRDDAHNHSVIDDLALGR